MGVTQRLCAVGVDGDRPGEFAVSVAEGGGEAHVVAVPMVLPSGPRKVVVVGRGDCAVAVVTVASSATVARSLFMSLLPSLGLQ